MVAISSAAVAAATKLLSPLLADLYGGAKGKVKESLKKVTLLAGAKKVARGLLKVENIKTVWSPDKELSVVEFYYPSKLEVGKEALLVESLRDLPSGGVVIQGIVGQGKSIFMRFLASTAMREECLSCLPIFLELRNVSDKKGIRYSVSRFLASLGIDVDDEGFEYLAASGKLVLLLDGFDEIVAAGVSDIINEIEWLQVRFPEMRIIISSRPGGEIQKVTGFEVIKILPLSGEDYEPFLRRLNVGAAKRVELLGALDKDSSTVHGVITTPLMLTLVVMVYESEREIPSTLPEFFEKLFHVVFTRHDRLKVGFERKHYSGLSERDLQRLFEAFCFMSMQLDYGRSLDLEEFHKSFCMALEYVDGCACKVDDFRKDIVKVACLMMEEGIDSATFLHKSIMEYYAAAFIKNSPDEVAQLFYQNAGENGGRTWGAVVDFLKSIDSFRYSRDYVLGSLPPHLAKMRKLLAARDGQELIGYLDEIYPDLVFTFDSVGDFSSMGLIETFDDDWLTIIDNHLTTAFFDTMDDASARVMVRRVVIGELRGYETKRNKDGLGMSIKVFLELSGDNYIWQALAYLEVELNEVVDKAQRIVDTYVRRKMIFEKKS